MITKMFLSWNEMQQSSRAEKIDTTYRERSNIPATQQKCTVSVLEAKSVNFVLLLLLYIWILDKFAECSSIRFSKQKEFKL